ncbi:MAG: hypothetical protein ACRCV6_01935 [Formosimonas sp.]
MATTQEYAYLSEHAYKDLATGVRDPKKPEYVTVGNKQYQVLDHVDNKSNGYQGTIYQDTRTKEIIVAHRGTESWSDAVTDLQMMSQRANRQMPDALALTAMALQLAKEQHAENPNINPAVTVTGHSLGGTLAEASAHRYGLRGEGFNGFGATNLTYKVPQGGHQFTTHVLAGDAVSAGAKHFGQVKVYASIHDVAVLSIRSATPTKMAANPISMGALVGDHSISNFTGSKGVNILKDPEAIHRAQVIKPMVDSYRDAVFHLNSGVAVLKPMVDVAEKAIDTSKKTFNAVKDAVNTLGNLPDRSKAIDEQMQRLYPGSAPIKSSVPIDSFESTSDAREYLKPATSTQVARAAPSIDSYEGNAPLQVTPQIASLQKQIREKAGEQFSSLPLKEQETTVALVAQQGIKFGAQTVDYIHVNDKGDVLVSFDGDKGFSSSVNLAQAKQTDAEQVLTASVDLQLSKEATLANRLEQSRSQGHAMI